MHGRNRGFRSVGVLAAAGGLALLTACGGGGGATTTPTTTAAAAATTTAAAATTAEATTAPAETTAAAPARPLANVFPDVAQATCIPAEGNTALRSSTGFTAIEAYLCDYSSVTPGAVVNFAQWSDAAGALSWYQDTVILGPRVENNDGWSVGGVQQGPLWTASQGGQTISTGLYENLPYTWEIRTATLDESNAVFGTLNFRPRTDIGG